MKILIFAGTSEGHSLYDRLRSENFDVSCSVATEYGKEVIDDKENVVVARMNKSEMISYIQSSGFDFVVDATHPYAKEVTTNIVLACNEVGVDYYRLLREESTLDSAVVFDTLDSAVSYLSEVEGNILSTIGSKELGKLKAITNYETRLYARILPVGETVSELVGGGFPSKNIICMQGPFSEELNVAMLRQFGCKFLLTKDSGKNGGFMEKLLATKKADATLVVIGRPLKEVGYSFEEIVELIYLRANENLPNKEEAKTPLAITKEVNREETSKRSRYFPFFLDVKDKNFLVVGAGKIATRRIKSLLNFDVKLTVVSSAFCDEFRLLLDEDSSSSGKKIDYIQRNFKDEDVKNRFCVIATTNDRTLNHRIGELAKSEGAYVNVCDRKEECDFIFSGIVRKDEVVVAITADGCSHLLAKEVTQKIRGMIDEN